MNPCIGVRREDKSRWERRVPVIPAHAGRLKEEHSVDVLVQPSSIRVFSEKEFVQASVEAEHRHVPQSHRFGGRVGVA